MTREERRLHEATKAAKLARLRDAESLALTRYDRTGSMADRWAWVEARRVARKTMVAA